MAVKNGDGIVVIPTDELMGRISKLMDCKLAEFAESFKVGRNTENDWLKLNDFCSSYNLSRTSVHRMVHSGKIEVKELSPRYKLYRWIE